MMMMMIMMAMMMMAMMMMAMAQKLFIKILSNYDNHDDDDNSGIDYNDPCIMMVMMLNTIVLMNLHL